MKKALLPIILIEINIVLALLIYSNIRLNKLEQKVFNTNKFVHEVLADDRAIKLEHLNSNDIVIGKAEAPLTVFLYSRVDCSVCADFFLSSYPLLKEEFIDQGKIRLVIRYLTHRSKPESLFATKSAYYANANGAFELFNRSMAENYPNIDRDFITSFIQENIKGLNDFDQFTGNNEMENWILTQANVIRSTGIQATPTFVLNDQVIKGNPSYERLAELINNQL